MTKYYYTPFLSTDQNERRTWNYYASKGARFANCKEPCTKDWMSPEQLATMLIADGLQDRAINIRLLVCYGAGTSRIDEDYIQWMAKTGGESIAKKLASSLGNNSAKRLVKVRVAGYKGPTHTGSDRGTLVKPEGAAAIRAKTAVAIKAKDQDSKRALIEASKPYKQALGQVSWGSPSDDPFALYLSNFERSMQLYSEFANEQYILWFDALGNLTVKYKEPLNYEPSAPLGAQQGPLSVIQDYDTLLIMAHGTWKEARGSESLGPGCIGAFSGPAQKDMQKMDVLRQQRLTGAKDDREIVERKW